MAKTSLAEATKVYDRSSTVIKYYLIKDKEFEKFSSTLWGLKRKLKLGELEDDGWWKTSLKDLLRYSADLSRAPLSFSYQGEDAIDQKTTFLQGRASMCADIYPDYSELMKQVVQQFKDAVKRDDNPILDLIREISDIDDLGTSAIVVTESRLIPFVKQEISKSFLTQLEIIPPRALRTSKTYSSIFVIGSPNWFRDFEYLFTAPRAAAVNLLMYNWLPNNWRPEIQIDSLLGVKTGYAIAEWQYESTADQVEEITEQFDILDELYDPVDWGDFVRRMRDEETGTDSYGMGGETVEAVPFLLEGDAVVWLEDNGSQYCIDPDAAGGALIEKIKCSNINRDSFVLLNTGADPDIIVPIANRILGSRAVEARQAQRHWKSLLRDQVRRRTLSVVEKRLKELGSGIANTANIRNWTATFSIKTEKYEDFLAIMRLIQLEEDAEYYWQQMTLIDRAHLSAGKKARNIQIQQLMKSDLTNLQILGRMDFQIPEMGAGSLSAFRVLDVLRDKKTEIPESRLNRIIELEDVSNNG
jgi:hypothetical protein